MPGLQILPSPRVNPYAGENTRAFMSMMSIMGEAETERRKDIMTKNILKALSGREGVEGIAQAATMEPGFSGGFSGILQRIASPFAERTMGLDDIIAGKGIESAFETTSPSQQISAKKLAMIEKAETEGDQEQVERLMGVRASLEGKTKEERIKTLQTGLNAAGGQYFYQEGLEGGAKQPKNPVLYDYYADLLREEGIPVRERSGRPVKNGGQSRFLDKGTGIPSETTSAATGPPTQKGTPLAGERLVPYVDETGRRSFVPESRISELGKEAEKEARVRLNQIFGSLPGDKQAEFGSMWAKAKKAGATDVEFLSEYLKND